MKKITSGVFIALGLGGLLALANCNTLRGFGQDTQRAGTAVENAAKK